MARRRVELDPERVRSDNVLLDRVELAFEVASPRELSRRLDIPLSTILKVRKGEAALNWQHRLVLMDKIGFAAARNMVLRLFPDRIAQRATALTNQQFQNTGADRYERTLGDDDANLLRFLESVAELNKEQSFLKLAEIDERVYARVVPNGALTAMERARIVESLMKVDPKKWSLSIARLTRYLESSAYMLDELEAIAFPFNDDQAELTAKLIKALEGYAGGAGLLSDAIGLSSSQISQLKSGSLKLNLQTRFKILDYIEREIGNDENVNFEMLNELATDPDRIHAVMDDLNFPRS